jgi:hypothetical protein
VVAGRVVAAAAAAGGEAGREHGTEDDETYAHEICSLFTET